MKVLALTIDRMERTATLYLMNTELMKLHLYREKELQPAPTVNITISILESSPKMQRYRTT